MDEIQREGFLMRQTVKTVAKIQETRSFDELFIEHWTAVYRRLVRLVGDPAEAEDLALETFMRLHRQYPLPEAGFSIGGWLYRVATNLGLRSIRSFKRRERYELAAGKGALDEAFTAQPPEILAQAEERRAVRTVLAQMDARQAQLLVLRHAGASYKEIAAAMDLAPSSIGPLLLRAEREFEKRYGKLQEEV
jgi:RNA polymerase sigma-70 factor (ECF subfamily)